MGIPVGGIIKGGKAIVKGIGVAIEVIEAIRLKAFEKLPKAAMDPIKKAFFDPVKGKFDERKLAKVVRDAQQKLLAHANASLKASDFLKKRKSEEKIA